MNPIRLPHIALPVLAALAIATPSEAPAQKKGDPTAEATLLGQFTDWGAYTAQPNGRKICFVISRPTSRQEKPPNRRSDEHGTYMFVSTRPADKVTNEISMLITNYAFNNQDATVTVGDSKFILQTRGDGAWTKDAADESRLVEAMRGGSTMTVTATTDRGTMTIDNFSLRGVTDALARAAKECG